MENRNLEDLNNERQIKKERKQMNYIRERDQKEGNYTP